MWDGVEIGGENKPGCVGEVEKLRSVGEGCGGGSVCSVIYGCFVMSLRYFSINYSFAYYDSAHLNMRNIRLDTCSDTFCYLPSRHLVFLLK